jgi:tetratricopeptide (TPR) repeat protein/RecA/RadA recombinase
MAFDVKELRMKGFSRVLELPRRALNFVGRETELERLRGGLGQYAIVAIEGRAGSGKTALALELGYELQGRGKSVLWLQARPGWSCESVLMALSEQGDISLDPQLSTAQQVVQLATALGESETYLFLDDFHHLTDKRILFEGLKTYLPRASVVVTSRTLVEEDALERVDCAIVSLESLNEGDVRALLTQLLQQHRLEKWLKAEPFQELMEKSLGSPMLCKLLVSLLLQGQLASLKDLRAATEEIYGLLLGELEQGLELAELELLKQLAVYRLPVPRAAFAEGVEVERALESLRRKLLAEPSPGRRYTVHDVFRDYYETRLKGPVKVDLHARCAAFYSTAHGSPQEAKESIFHSIAASQPESAAEVLVEYGKRFYQAAQYDYLLDHIESLAEHAGQNRLSLLTLKAEVLAMIGGTRESLALFTQIENESTDVHQQVRALNSRCHLVLEQGQLSEAIDLADRAIGKLAGLTGRRPGRVKALNGKALALARQGHDHRASLAASVESLKICEQIQDPRGECYAHYSQALVYRHRDDWHSSLDAARRAISAAHRGRETRLAFLARFLEGTALLELGENTQAAKATEQAYNDSADYPDPLSRSLALLGYALSRARAGDWDRAQRLSSEALDFGIRHGGRVFAAQLYLTAGQMAEGCGLEVEARNRYESGLEFARTASAWPLEADLTLRLELLSSEPHPDVFRSISQKAESLELLGLCFRGRLAVGFVDAQAGKSVKVETPPDWRPGQDDELFGDYLSHYDQAGPPGGVWNSLALRLSTSVSYPFRVTTNEGARRATAKEIDSLRKDCERFDLWLDLPNKRVVEKSKGEIKLLRRKVLTRLLLCLMKAAGMPHRQQEVYLQVWGPPYQDESSAAQVRKNVSALRDMLEPDRSKPRYLKVREGTFGAKGGYYFCADAKFCLVEAL